MNFYRGFAEIFKNILTRSCAYDKMNRKNG